MTPWELDRSETVLSNKWIEVLRNWYRINGNLRDYYIVNRQGFVLVVAHDNADRLVLVRQYRPATDRFYISLPAGYIEPDEEPEDAARRELREETGASAANWQRVGELHPLPGYVCSPAFVFRCELDESSGKSPDTIDDGEIAAVLRVPRIQVLDMIISGEIKEMQAVAAILLSEAVDHKS